MAHHHYGSPWQYVASATNEVRKLVGVLARLGSSEHLDEAVEIERRLKKLREAVRGLKVPPP